MKNLKTWAFIGFLTVFPFENVQAMSLDEIYRDVVRSDNRGYLPMFVKNREAPDFIVDKEFLKDVPEPKAENNSPVNPDLEIVKFENQRKIHEEQVRKKWAAWNKVVQNVKNGKVTASELRELEVKAGENNPQAVEMLAWIYAKGVGVKSDLIKAFRLYMQAENLGVPNAKLNAAKVYKVMPRQMREELVAYQ